MWKLSTNFVVKGSPCGAGLKWSYLQAECCLHIISMIHPFHLMLAMRVHMFHPTLVGVLPLHPIRSRYITVSSNRELGTLFHAKWGRDTHLMQKEDGWEPRSMFHPIEGGVFVNQYVQQLRIQKSLLHCSSLSRFETQTTGRCSKVKQEKNMTLEPCSCRKTRNTEPASGFLLS